MSILIATEWNKHMHLIMQILSDYNYIHSKLKCRLHEIVVLLLINDKVSTGPCHQQNFRHDSKGYKTIK